MSFSLKTGQLPLLMLVVLASYTNSSVLKGSAKSISTDESLDGSDHQCYRECVAGDVRVCEYDFTLENYQTMSKACFDCPLNITDCSRKDCIAADGVGKSVTVVNRKIPGPKIEVCVGDTIVVSFHNELLDEGSTIHWHGHHQKNTPYMDGVPMVTQCPVPVHTTFQYRFEAEHIGTHFWHSHTGMQRTDGDTGALIIREPETHHSNLYDFDLSEHVMHIVDWIHDTGTSVYTKNTHAGAGEQAASLLINGKGRFLQFAASRSFFTPAERFTVQKGFSYRFRLINSEFLVCPVELSIVGHNLTIISSDGNDIEPIEAVSLISYAGERFDFIVTADQDVDNYWFMFRGLLNCNDRFNSVKQVALLHYEGASEDEPETAPSWEESFREGLQVNGVNIGTGHTDTIAIPELRSVEPDDDSLKETPDVQLYIAYDFHVRDNTTFNKDPYYGVNQVAANLLTLMPQLNHISMKMPNIVLMTARDKIIPEEHFCNEDTVDNCEEEFCSCSHVVELPLNSVVEIVIIDEGQNFDSNHPMHLHGYAFRVIAMERLDNAITKEEVMRLDAEGLIARNLNGAPLKDTVTVPDGGFTIIRFVANNPGYWLFHCHLELHAEIGMAMVFKVGEHEDFLPIPENFPTCGDYVPAK